MLPIKYDRKHGHTAIKKQNSWSARALALGGLTALLLSLSACTSAPRAVPDNPDIASWQGRLAMTVDSQPPERMAASFTLQGSEQAGSLALFTPLGSTIARAQWSAQGATLAQGQSVREFASLHDMLSHFASAALPVPAMFDWLQGIAHDAPGWHVDLSQKDQGRIFASRQYPKPAVDLRLILD